MLTIYAAMTDARLAKLETQILVRIMQLRPAVAPTTRRLLEQCEAELAQVQAEQRRRATRES